MNNTTNSTDGVTLAPSPAPAPAADKVYIAGLFDYAGFEWGPLVFNATIAMLQNRTNGWWNVILNGTEIVSTIRDANCAEKKAVDEYWSLREWGQPLHGVVGGRCSGASAAVARIAGLENVPQVSPSASSSRLSNADDYSSFFRLVAPDDSRGQVGALVTLLRSFDWDRVSVISTDTPYAKDLATQFGTAWVGYHNATGATDAERAWTGETPYAHTISLPDGQGSIEDSSIRQALDGVPTDKPVQNSRVILLLAHQKDAYRILKLAYETTFQPDTIWIAPDGWAGRDDVNEISSSLPEYPGFLGVSPYVDSSRMGYQDYIKLFIEYQEGLGIPSSDIIEELPTFAAELVDSILSLAFALDNVSAESRNDGNHAETVQALHNLDVWRGVSGRIRFTAEGHRDNPRYRVSNFVSPSIGWRTVGSVGTTVDSAKINLDEICWAQEGCALQEPPSDKYPVPCIIYKVDTWVLVVIPIIVVLMLASLARRITPNCRSILASNPCRTDHNLQQSHDDGV